MNSKKVNGICAVNVLMIMDKCQYSCLLVNLLYLSLNSFLPVQKSKGSIKKKMVHVFSFIIKLMRYES